MKVMAIFINLNWKSKVAGGIADEVALFVRFTFGV